MDVSIQPAKPMGLDSLSVCEIRSAVIAIKRCEVGKTFSEIADDLDIPPTTLSSRISRVEAVFGTLFICGSGGRRIAASTKRGKRFETTMNTALGTIARLARSEADTDEISTTENIEAVRNTLKQRRRDRKRDAESARVRALWEAVPENERPSAPTPQMYEAARHPKTKGRKR